MSDGIGVVEETEKAVENESTMEFEEFVDNFIKTGEISMGKFTPKEILLFGLELYSKFDDKIELAKLLVSQLVLLPSKTKLRESFTTKIVSILSELEGNLEFLMVLDPDDLDDNSRSQLGQILIKSYLASEGQPSSNSIQQLLKFNKVNFDLESIIDSSGGAKLISIIQKTSTMPTPYHPYYLFNTIMPILFQNNQVDHHLKLFTQTLHSLPEIPFLQSPNNIEESLIDRLTKIIITHPKESSISAFEALHLLISKSSFNITKYIFVMDVAVLSTLMIRSIKRLSKFRGLESVQEILFNLDSIIYTGTTTPEGLFPKIDMIMEVINLIKYMKVQDVGEFIDGIKLRVSNARDVLVDDKDRLNLDILQFTLDTLPQET